MYLAKVNLVYVLSCLFALLCIVHGKCLNDGDYGHPQSDYNQRLFSYSSKAPVQPSTSSELKFLTFNLQSGYLTNCVSDVHTQANLMKGMDYVGTQETVQGVDTRCNKCNMPQTIADVAGMASRFVMTIPWRTGQYGINAATSQTVLDTKWTMLNYGGVEQRVLVAVKTQPPALQGRYLWFINIHVEYYVPAARYSQIAQILNFVTGTLLVSDPTAVIVMTGDFNGGPWDPVYTTMKAALFQNTWELYHGNINDGNTMPADWPGSRFDHIWFRAPAGVSVQVKNAYVPDVRYSDHRPYTATLKFTVNGGSNPTPAPVTAKPPTPAPTAKPPTPAPVTPKPTASPPLQPTTKPAGAVVCVGPIWENAPVTISCPIPTQKITQVQFASYGNPTGTCGNYKLGNCIGGSSMAVLNDKCLGRSTCTFPVANNVFGDPCPKNGKHLLAQVVCN